MTDHDDIEIIDANGCRVTPEQAAGQMVLTSLAAAAGAPNPEPALAAGRKRLAFLPRGSAAVAVLCRHAGQPQRLVAEFPVLTSLLHLQVVSEAAGERLRVSAVRTPAGWTFALSPVDAADLMPDWPVHWVLPLPDETARELVLVLEVPEDAVVAAENAAVAPEPAATMAAAERPFSVDPATAEVDQAAIFFREAEILHTALATRDPAAQTAFGVVIAELLAAAWQAPSRATLRACTDPAAADAATARWSLLMTAADNFRNAVATLVQGWRQ